MHQPCYKNPMTDIYEIPWVWLHCVKDYLDMPLLLEQYPDIHATFNLVPLLLEQINDYAGGAQDGFLNLSYKNAQDLTPSEKALIISRFFNANFDTMIKTHPRYLDLFKKRGQIRTREDTLAIAERFSVDEFRDLQVWFSLAWTDAFLAANDPTLKRLIEKGANYTEKDKGDLYKSHLDIVRRIIPTYRRLQDKGQIEISTSPFYHPIMPLLCDVATAKGPQPGIELPTNTFRHPEDVVIQTNMAIEYHRSLFGKPPVGMWPPEGGVCDKLIPMLYALGIRWIAADESILAKSLHRGVFKRDLAGNIDDLKTLYQPYTVKSGDARVTVVFRDHYLSDLIGFQYHSWFSRDAADDFVRRLDALHAIVKQDERPYLVTILLDGENCWEYFEKDGFYFLSRLYESLSENKNLKSVTVNEFIEKFGAVRELTHLHTGSWIKGNFSTWVGNEHNNKAWDYLSDAREAVFDHIEKHKSTLSAQQIAEAKRSIYVAEGSDWNWWYGDEYSSGADDTFDALFRGFLSNAYRCVGLHPPARLQIPIATGGEMGTIFRPTDFIKPILDGKVTNYYEWFAAGRYDPTSASIAAHKPQILIRNLFWGFDDRNLYIRVDPNVEILNLLDMKKIRLEIFLISDSSLKIDFFREEGSNSTLAHIHSGSISHWEQHEQMDVDLFAVGDVLEVRLPFSQFGFQHGQIVTMQVVINFDGKEIERCPAYKPIAIQLPTTDFESEMWLV